MRSKLSNRRARQQCVDQDGAADTIGLPPFVLVLLQLVRPAQPGITRDPMVSQVSGWNSCIWRPFHNELDPITALVLWRCSLAVINGRDGKTTARDPRIVHTFLSPGGRSLSPSVSSVAPRRLVVFVLVLISSRLEPSLHHALSICSVSRLLRMFPAMKLPTGLAKPKPLAGRSCPSRHRYVT